jgi:ankyrin repeat protein
MEEKNRMSSAEDAYSPPYVSNLPLHNALLRQDETAAVALIHNGANVNQRDVHGVTPLSIVSCCFPKVEIAQLLLSKGAHVDGLTRNPMDIGQLG